MARAIFSWFRVRVSQVEAMWEEPTTRRGVQKLRRVRRRNSALPFVAVVLAARTDVAQIV